MIPQVRIYTASWRAGAGWSPTVFAQESPTCSARFDAENDLYSFALTVPTRNLIAALKAAGVRRLIVQSSFGVGDSRRDAGLLERVFYALLLRGAYADKVLQEQAVRESGLDYTIVRPTRLTTAAGAGRYTARVGPGPVPSSIARADVARFILDALGTREYVGKTVSLGGRTRPTETATQIPAEADHPSASPSVRTTMRGIRRAHGAAQHQAKPLLRSRPRRSWSSCRELAERPVRHLFVAATSVSVASRKPFSLLRRRLKQP